MTHPLVERAACGQLPAWADLDDKRRRHAERVAGLLDDWAIAGGLPPEERTRWIAAGYLHDAVKKKHAKEPQKIQQETLKIYQKHGMKPPLGGCLPMLAQFPIFIGLFAALRCSILLREQPFFG